MAARLTAYVVVGIVAATLIAGLIVGAQRNENDSDGPVDLIVQNANIYTAGSGGTMAEAMAIRGNQILRVGSDRDIARLRKPQTTVIDAKGGAVVPGFSDAHAHLVDGGLNLDRVDLTDASTLEEIEERVQTWAEAHPDAAWVTGRGWTFAAFGSSAPTRQQLDAIVPGKPVQLVSEDGKASWVNTRALRAAAITRKTVSPEGGAIVKDARSGEPTGVLRGAAMSLVSRHVPRASIEERGRALRAAIAEANRFGITSIQTPDGTADELELFAEARKAGDLTVRLYSALALRGEVNDAKLRELDAIASRYPDDPLFKSGAVSFTLDGSIETRTAALLEPYADETSSGVPTIAPDDFNRMVRLLDARGWQVLAAAVGDRAVQMALNAFEHAVRSNPVPERGRRHRIEHVGTVDILDQPRFGALGVIASMQPATTLPTAERIDLLTSAIGAARASRASAYASIASGRGRLAFGSDWPFASFNPMVGLHAAVTRTTTDNTPDGGWYPAERLALPAAIDAYTSGAAWASFDEQRKGTLQAGMLADIVVLSEDIFEAPPSRLASTRVALTIFDGKIVYRRDNSHTN
jgi:predicted amidohydrolase YtcJ